MIKLSKMIVVGVGLAFGSFGLMPGLFFQMSVAGAEEAKMESKHMMPEGNHNVDVEAFIEEKNKAIGAAKEVVRENMAKVEEKRKAAEEFKAQAEAMRDELKGKLEEIKEKTEETKNKIQEKDVREISAISMNHPKAGVVRETVKVFIEEVKVIKTTLHSDLKAAQTRDEKKAAIEKAKTAFDASLMRLRKKLMDEAGV